MAEVKTVEQLPPTYWEYPFLYKGMSIEEYEKEREYHGTHMKEVHSGVYKPLWKQRGEVHDAFEG